MCKGLEVREPSAFGEPEAECEVAVISFKVALSCIHHIGAGSLLLPPLDHPAVWSINVRCHTYRTESELSLPSSCSKSAGQEGRNNDLDC